MRKSPLNIRSELGMWGAGPCSSQAAAMSELLLRSSVPAQPLRVQRLVLETLILSEPAQ